MKIHDADAWSNTASDYDETAYQITFHYSSTSIEKSGAKADIENKKSLKVLDVGGGTGEIGLELARLSNSSNSDLQHYTTDFSPGMIKLATQKASEFKDKIQCLVMDGANLEFESNVFDYIYSMFAYFLFPERKKSINEMHRVLKVGGKVSLSIWTENHFGLSCFGAVKRVGFDMSGFSFKPLNNKDALVQEMSDAGFKDIQLIDAEKIIYHDADKVDDFIKTSISNPMYQQILDGKTDEEVTKFIAKFKEELLENFVTEDRKKLKFVTKAVIGIGSK